MSEPAEGACQAYARSWCETDAPRGASANDNNDWPAGVRSAGEEKGEEEEGRTSNKFPVRPQLMRTWTKEQRIVSQREANET